MKKIISILIAAVVLAGCAKTPDAVTTGSIYGVITDKATGEPIKSAGVQLNPVGTKTVTGTEGQYEFIDLPAGEYSLQVTKTGYTDLVGYKIKVTANKTNKGDVQIEKLPPSLRVVSDKTTDIDELDFGNADADVTRSFNIFNDGPEPLEWEITATSNWISKISKESGTLKAGATQAIIITIDRNLLAGGENTTTVHITSDNGSKNITVKATNSRKLAILNALTVTEIAASTAVFNGKVIDEGYPKYTERGFVYSTSSMPTIETSIAKITSAATTDVDFYGRATGLTLDQHYYVRAYAINNTGTSYSSNEVSFTATAVVPILTTQEVTEIYATTATYNGTVVYAGDPAYIERGFVYGTLTNPTVDDNDMKVVSGSGTGDFSANLTGLIEGTTYYVRAYATTVKTTVYGNLVSFTPFHPDYISIGGLMVQREDISVYVNWTSAKSLCESSNIGGHTKWRLPTLSELSMMYTNIGTIRGFKTSQACYWSSTVYPDGTGKYYLINFSTGSQDYDYPNNATAISRSYYARCVRTLP